MNHLLVVVVVVGGDGGNRQCVRRGRDLERAGERLGDREEEKIRG